MIRSYGDAATRQLFEADDRRRFGSISRIALRKLQQLNAVSNIEDMASPPGNRLEALRGRRRGQHSIRINDQWRVCFRWHGGHAYEVEIVDYH